MQAGWGPLILRASLALGFFRAEGLRCTSRLPGHQLAAAAIQHISVSAPCKARSLDSFPLLLATHYFAPLAAVFTWPFL